ncbi:MAG: thiamine pyrophosphate-dependent dehydrogenase E1 component subunit alpha [Planctomycetota bacterium]|jgi:TPP-dependent pyruvate/acetoin dehydrogenase alpha subunit|nr:thiamine pyrophosphate-dependent dehydrogenase E1 component subunit alpha [Planctomycetota bacterium]
MTDVQRVLAADGSVVGTVPDLSDERLRELLVHMLRVRCIDERMLKLQRSGRVGFVGSTLGLEGAMIGSAAALRSQDWMWSGLREGGAAVMRGLPLDEYVAQMYCNSNDTAKGRQMCNHFQHKGSHYPSWSSVIGTQLAHGVGAALAASRRGLDEVHAIYCGDGASSSNGFHSGLNFAGVWRAPCVFVLVDNGWAISVSSKAQTAADSYADKGIAYGVRGIEVDGNDVLASLAATEEAVERARAGDGPSLVVLSTYRMLGHSSSDDPTRYRDPAEVDAWAQKDPIDRYEAFLIERGVLAPGGREELAARTLAELDEVIAEQEAADPMSTRTLVEDVYADVPDHLRRQYNEFARIQEAHGEARPGEGAFPL